MLAEQLRQINESYTEVSEMLALKAQQINELEGQVTTLKDNLQQQKEEYD